MCGRMTLTLREFDEVLAALVHVLADTVAVDEGTAAQYRPRYNAAPTQPLLVIRRSGEHPVLGVGLWGLQAPPGRPPLINARAETAATRPPFKDAFARRRCLIPTDGFFEWKKSRTGRQPLWFHRRDGQLLLLAGLYDDLPRPEGAARTKFAVLTCPANRPVGAVHDRMPVVLQPTEAAAWLTAPSPQLLHPADEDVLVATPVSTRVNSVHNDDADCLRPRRDEGQIPLF
jgi:putative SOS response-associated peptidase YedK